MVAWGSRQCAVTGLWLCVGTGAVRLVRTQCVMLLLVILWVDRNVWLNLFLILDDLNLSLLLLLTLLW
jgi:hypothetical protein